MLCENLGNLIGGHMDIGGLAAVGIEHLDDRLILTDAYAACLCNDNIGELALFKLLGAGGETGARTRGDAAGRHADDDAHTVLSLAAYTDLGFHIITKCLKFS